MMAEAGRELRHILVAGAVLAGDDGSAVGPGKLLDRLRRDNEGVAVQVVDAGAVYGLDHVLGVLHIVFEAMDRGITVANRPEAEVLLRLACTDQIADALLRAGLREGRRDCCFVAFTKDREALRRFGDSLAAEFDLDDSVLEPSPEKKAGIARQLQVDPDRLAAAGVSFVDFLLERAAILVRD